MGDVRVGESESSTDGMVITEAWPSKIGGSADESCESCERLDCEGLLVCGLAPGGGEGGANAKDGPVVFEDIEVSEARRQSVGDVDGRWGWVLELVAIRRIGAFGVTDWPGSGTETMRDLDTLALDSPAPDLEALAALKLWRTASEPEIVSRRWCSRVVCPS